MTTFTTF